MLHPATPSRPDRLLRWLVQGLVLTLALVLHPATRLPAGPFTRDPVDQFRQALLLEQNKSITYKSRLDVDDKALDLALDFRRRNLEQAARDLKTTSDLSRALLLIDWPRPPRSRSERDAETKFDKGARDIESEIRREMAQLFVKKVQATIRASATTPDAVAGQVATANLVGETVSSAGDLQDESLLLYKEFEPLAENLATLVTAPSFRVREAAARALGQFPNSPKIAGPALKALLSPPNPESTRKAAADALLNLALLVTPNQPVRSSEPGVSVRETRRPGKIFQLPDVAAVVTQIARAAGVGLSDPSVAIRRQCIKAIRQAADTLPSEIKVLLPVSSSEVDLPPLERRWSPDERERVLERRKQIAEDLKILKPSLAAFRDQANALTRAAIDPDPEVRLNARRTLDSLAQTRDQIQRLSTSVPDKPTLKKLPGGKDDVRRPTAPADHVAVGYYQEKNGDKKDDEKKEPKKDEEPEDNDPDPIGSLLHKVGDYLVQSGFVDPRAESRRAAVEAMESSGTFGASFIPALTKRLKDDDEFVRLIAARALGKLAPRQAEEVVPALVCNLDDPDLDARISAVRALGLFGEAGSRAVPAISDRLLKGDVEYRMAAMKALEGIGTDSAPALPQLARALTDGDPRIRAEAARVIGLFGTVSQEYLDALRRMTTDPDSDVRKSASAAILSIVGK
ncbi:MAG: HEAT repeat domain-containing protein [Gemmataceae bacterium]